MKPLLAFLLFAGLYAAAAPDMIPYFSGSVFPQPQSFEAAGRPVPVSEALVSFDFGENPVPSAPYAEKLLRKRLEGVANPQAGKVNIVLLEKDDPGAAGLNLPSGEAWKIDGGYAVDCVTGGGGTTIYGIGNGNRGVFYAAMSILQLIDRENNALLPARIADFPVWSDRYVTDLYLNTPDAAPEFYGMWKINGFALQTFNSWRDMNPEAKPPYGGFKTMGDALAAFGRFYETSGGLVDLMLAPRIYGFDDKPKFDCSDEQMIDQLIADTLNACSFHVKHFMFRVDDWVPEVDGRYEFPGAGEPARFRSLGQAHGYLMRRIYEAVHPVYPDVQFSFCPGPYSIESHRATVDPAREYLADLAREMPDAVQVVWTGPQVGSPVISASDTATYAALVPGHKLLTWHNATAIAGLFCCPDDLEMHPGFEQLNEGIFFANAEGTGKGRNRAADLTMAAYAWNPDGCRKQEAYLDAAAKLWNVDRAGFSDVLRLFRAISSSGDRKERAAMLNELRSGMEQCRNFMDESVFNGYYEREYASATASVPVVNVKSGPLSAAVDGLLNDEIWQYHAAEIAIPGPARAVGKIYYDRKDDIIYLAWQSPDDAPVTMSFVFPDTEGRACRITVNPDGSLQTSYHWVLEWKPEIAVKTVGTDNGGYTAEMAIPIAAFKQATLPPDAAVSPGIVWQFQAEHRGSLFAPPNPKDRGDVNCFAELRF